MHSLALAIRPAPATAAATEAAKAATAVTAVTAGPAGDRRRRGGGATSRYLATPICSLLCLLAAGPASAGPAQPLAGSTRVTLAAETVAEGTTVVTVRNPAAATVRGFEIAHQLQYGADSGRAVVRRGLWADLADAYNSVPVTGEEHAERRQLGREAILVRKVAVAGEDTVATTFYLPPEVLSHEAGKWTLALESAPSRTRNTTTEVTTFPLRSTLSYANQPSEERTSEGKLAFGRTYISSKQREAVRDANGDLVSFRELESETVQDSQSALLDLGTYWTIARGTRLGQLEAGFTGGGAWETDEINLLDQRLTGYLGGELRATSEVVDGRWGSLAVRLGGSDERFLIIDPVYDEAGEPIGTTTSIERHRLPTWEVVVAGATPLYQLHGHTLAKVEGRVSLLRSFSESDGQTGAEANGDSGRPPSSEQRASFELGISLELPMGSKVGIRARLDTLDLPGEAGQRVDDVQWVSGMTAGMTMRF